MTMSSYHRNCHNKEMQYTTTFFNVAWCSDHDCVKDGNVSWNQPSNIIFRINY